MNSALSFEECQNLENLGQLQSMITSLEYFIQENGEWTNPLIGGNENLKESLWEAVEKMQNVYEELEKMLFSQK